MTGKYIGDFIDNTSLRNKYKFQLNLASIHIFLDRNNGLEDLRKYFSISKQEFINICRDLSETIYLFVDEWDKDLSVSWDLKGNDLKRCVDCARLLLVHDKSIFDISNITQQSELEVRGGIASLGFVIKRRANEIA